MSKLVQEKVEQAIGILDELGIDLWLTFVRETSAGGDPVLPLIYGEADLTWQSALLLSRDGGRVALVGRFEVEAARATGAYPTVLGYDESPAPELLRLLGELNPAQIAINYSLDDVLADGLGHGLYRVLRGYLQDTLYAERLMSAQDIISLLRGRKSPAEVARIRAAVETTAEIYRRTFDAVAPGMTEIEVGDFMAAQMAEMGVEPSWHAGHCPTVNAGADSPVGHVGRGEYRVARGQLLHFDFGVRQNSYCSDIQRVVYFPQPGEDGAPPPVRRAFATVAGAIQAAVDAMRPGVLGKEVDAVARRRVIEAGYPEYKHATGHQVGRLAHDGGALLGPEWARYGQTPNRPLEAGHVYAVELGVEVEGYGYVGLEENVLVTETGAEYLSEPQVEAILR
ncbi:MAG: Xaa-Pro peptidase family protein [Anaerolineae bacterium]|jgi:Xaa-Pro aminopeptidase